MELIVKFFHFWRYLVLLKVVNQVKYKVTVYTGSMKFAGTDEKISVAIAGNRCCSLFTFLELVVNVFIVFWKDVTTVRNGFTGTEFHTLDKMFADDFEKVEQVHNCIIFCCCWIVNLRYCM